MSRAVWLVIAGIVSVQLGASFAKDLFGTISPTALVWLRLATSALILAAIARPRLRGRSGRDWQVAVAFGLCLGLMNWAIYQSFSRIPLGIAVTLEFIGPLALAVVGSRRARDLVWVGLALVGVALLGAERAELDLVGVLFALVAGAAWAAYILLSASTGRRWPGFDGLAVASVIAAVVLAPAAIVAGGTTLLEAHVLLIGTVIGVLSSVIPYSFELVALRTLRPSVFGILMSLEPAAAALAAAAVLGELLSAWQCLAIACVVVASIGATRTGGPVHHEPAPD
ncbi:EamA family transporter [Nocardioides sp. LHG3406-4]|uniref:EamA family transporter n=1 Tax=Nocardioides sp. LHG3406-4 TaxID=2804575 RepID=UPI003CF9FDCC